MATTNHRPPVDRRLSERFPCALRVSCRPLKALARPPWRGKALDISTRGIALVVRHRLKPGQFLALNLRSSGEHVCRDLEAHVIHTKRQPDGRWLAGCAFVQCFSDEELGVLLT